MSDKPQIVTMDVGGRHNADLAASAGRVIESGSWKRQNIVLLIPAGRMVPSKAALSWMNLAWPPNQAVVRWLCINMEVGQAYSEAISQVLAHPDLSGFQYVATLEHDNLPPPDAFVRLVGHMERHPEFAAISGLYFTKYENGVPQIWGDPRDPVQNFRPQPPDPNGGLVECCGIGMGAALWRLAMFKDERLRRPWFKTLNGLDGQGCGTQDLYFCSDARKHGYRFAVACDVRVGHLDPQTDIVW